MPESILRSSDVVARVKLGRTTVWRLERDGQFPRRRNLGGGIVGWLESEITTWIESRPVASGDRPDAADEPATKP